MTAPRPAEEHEERTDEETRGRCGYTVVDKYGEEQPCDRPATGWRWYQDVEHEDTLDVACELHENEGGRRLSRLAAVERERDERIDPHDAAAWVADRIAPIQARAVAAEAREAELRARLEEYRQTRENLRDAMRFGDGSHTIDGRWIVRKLDEIDPAAPSPQEAGQ